MNFDMTCFFRRYRNQLILFVLACIVYLPAIILNELPQRDVAMRYAPMAEAFAKFDFINAFHPRAGFIHSFVAGTIALIFGCGGFLATALSSSLFSALTVFPLYGIFRRAFSEANAMLGTFLFILAPPLAELATSGLRDSTKTFGFILSVYALIRMLNEHKKLAPRFWLAAGCGALVSSRADGAFFALFFIIAAFAIEIIFCKTLRRSLILAVLVLLFLLPSLAVNMRMTGYAVPDVRHALLLKKIEDKTNLRLHIDTAYFSLDSGNPANKTVYKHNLANKGKKPRSEFSADNSKSRGKFYVFLSILNTFFKGSVPFLFIPALIILIISMARRSWNMAEKTIFYSLIGHHILFVLQLAIAIFSGADTGRMDFSARYIISISPLWFGWSARAFISVFLIMKKKFINKRVQLFAGIALAVFTLCAFAKIIYNTGCFRTKTVAKLSFLREMANIIKQDYKGPDSYPASEVLWQMDYISHKKPLIYASGKISEIGWFSGGDATKYYLPQIQLKHTDYILTFEPELYSDAVGKKLLVPIAEKQYAKERYTLLKIVREKE